MVAVKEYRVVMPVTVEEYRIAQLYMTARTQLMEAQQPDGAGVEILENHPATHPRLGASQYTRKLFHIDRRFPGWLRMIAPKSGSCLVEESYNSYPHTLTQVTFPLFSKFKITIETIHRDDRGKEDNVHKLSSEQLKKREVVNIDIAEKRKDEAKMYDGADNDPARFRSQRTGRGPLDRGWQERVEPVMCAYKLVSCEFDYWGLQSKVESYMHQYERDLFFNANRNMFCWIDEWVGLTLPDVRRFEAQVAERTNLITEVKEGKREGVDIQSLPPVVALRNSEEAAGSLVVSASRTFPSSEAPAQAAQERHAEQVRIEGRSEGEQTNQHALASKAVPSKIIRFRADQREPREGEPVCAVAGCRQYGRYQVKATGHFVCSVECRLELTQTRLNGNSWEERRTEQGWSYFLNHSSCSSHWTPS